MFRPQKHLVIQLSSFVISQEIPLLTVGIEFDQRCCEVSLLKTEAKKIYSEVGSILNGGAALHYGSLRTAKKLKAGLFTKTIPVK